MEAPRPALAAALALALLAPAFSGCLGSSDTNPEAADAPAPEPTLRERWREALPALRNGSTEAAPLERVPGRNGSGVTVAVVDTGVNPFHAFFRGGGPSQPGALPVRAVNAATGKPPIYVPTPAPKGEKPPGWAADVVEPETLYRFGGTDLLYYSAREDLQKLDYAGHGTVTSATVLANAPDVTVVMVHVNSSTLMEGIEWSIAQPWIDVVSVSWGCPANCAPLYPLLRASSDYPALAEKAWEKGKLWVNSAGNDPTPHTTDAIDGPPHVVAVGGADAQHRGEVPDASNLADVVSDWTVTGPEADTLTGYGNHSGTSFAAPTVAGTLARTIRLLREATGHAGGIEDGTLVDADGTRVTNGDLRRAMNRTAVYWGPGDYRVPEPGEVEKTDPDDTPTPVNPAAPWLQMGWGYVNGTLAPAMAEALLSGELPDKPDAAEAYMERKHQARHRLWP